MKTFFHNCKVVKVQDHTAAGTTDVTSDAVDMSQDGGYGGVCFIGSYGTAAAGNKPHAEQSSDNGSADTFADLLGSEVGVGSSDEEVMLDVSQPQERYVRSVWARGTSSTLESIYAILYNPRVVPVDNTTAGTIHGELHVAPAEGTK